MLITVAIPCYKSAKTIERVVAEIKTAVTAREGNDYQIVLVNDYPDDDTFDVIRKLCAEDCKIIGVNLSKNFGQTYAKMAALPFVDGDVLVYMDDDGQHPADQIYRLIDKLDEGYDMVYAYFPHKKHSLFKRLTSKLNSAVLEFNGTKPKGITLSSYCALSRMTVDALKQYKSPFPSIGGFLGGVIKRYANVEMEHRERLEGTSNYTLAKLLKLWFTGFLNFSVKPIRVASSMGFVSAGVGFIYGLYIIIRKLVDPAIAAGYASMIAILLFIGGMIMVMIGLVGEYIGRIFMTVSDQPQYVIRETINAKKEAN